MKKINVILFLMFICLIISIPATFAQDNQTITDEDNVTDYYFDVNADSDGNGLKDTPFKNFTDVRVKDNTTIHLASGEYIFEKSREFSNVSFYGHNPHDTILNGNGSALTIKGIANFRNLTLTNFKISNVGELNAFSTVFTQLIATKTSYNNTWGGAIYAESNKNIYLDNCTFFDNHAEYGGAIYVKGGNLVVLNSLFYDNIAYNFGGAIAGKSNVKAVINNTRFFNHKSVNDAGGAIYLVSSSLKAFNLTVVNSTSTFGSAITALGSTLDLKNSHFEDNHARYDGGAIYEMYGSISINSSKFITNTARNGGGLFIDDVTVYGIENNEFIKNSASNCAGGVYYFLKNDINLTANHFENNSAGNFDDALYISSLNMTIGNGNYITYVYNITYNSTIPHKYDLRDYGYVTIPKNQESGGNCWAFAALSALESCVLKASGEVLDLSEENMKNLMASFSDYGYNSYPVNEGGITKMAVGYLTSWMGPVNETDDLYDDASHISPLLNSVLHIQNVLYLARSNYTDNDAIKEAILKYGAVATTMHYDSKSISLYHGVAFHYYTGDLNSNHAVTIVGWDDDLTLRGKTGAWLVKNSWGLDWANDGYFYVSYYDTVFAKPGAYNSYTFILNDTQKFDKNYQHEVSGPTDYFYIPQNSIWYENAFYATDNEFLSGVSTHFNGATDWEFYIYVNSKLKLSQSGSSVAGYHTFNFDYPVPLVKGDLFEVLFKVTTEGHAGAPISEASSLNKLTYAPGISFVSSDGIHFDDLYNLVWMDYPGHYYLSQVACIKAFTQLITLNPTVKNLNITYDSLDLYNITLSLFDENNNSVKNGNVTFMVNGVSFTVDVYNGIAFLKTPFVLGINNISWSFDSPNYHSLNGNATFEVLPVKLDVGIDILQDFNNAYVNMTFSQLINENVTVTINGNNQTFKSVNGTIHINFTDLEYGQYNITVKVDSELYDCSNQSSFFVDVKRTYLNVTAMTSVYDSGDYYQVQLLDEFGQPVTGVQVRIVLNNFTYLKFVDSNGCAKVPTRLSVGDYEVDVRFSGNGKYHKSRNASQVTVVPSKTTLNITSIVYDSFDFFNITVNVSDQFNRPMGDGEILFNINGDDYAVNLSNCQAVLKTHMIVGKNRIEASFTNENYISSYANVSFEVSPIRIDMNISVLQDFNNAHIGFTLSQPLNETLIVNINGANRTIETVDGKAYFNLTDLDYGKYDISVNVDNDIYDCKNQSSFFVDVKRTHLNASDFTTVYNSGELYSVCLLDQFNLPVIGREVKFLIGENVYLNVTDENGIATVAISLKDSIYSVVILFEGDSLHVKSQNTSTIIVKSSVILPDSRNYTLNSNYEFYLLVKNGNALRNALVTVNINDEAYDVQTDSEGKALFTIPVKYGNYEICFINPATGEVASQNITVVKRITLNADMKVYYGSKSKYIIRVCDDDGEFIGGLEVQISLNKKVYNLRTDNKGYVFLKINLKAGKYKVTATYKGFSTTNKITVKPTLITKNKKVKRAKKITYQAKLLKTNGKAFKGKKITFKIKGKTYKAKTNKKGIAKIKIRNLKVGKHKITVKCGKLKSTRKITVKR